MTSVEELLLLSRALQEMKAQSIGFLFKKPVEDWVLTKDNKKPQATDFIHHTLWLDNTPLQEIKQQLTRYWRASSFIKFLLSVFTPIKKRETLWIYYSLQSLFYKLHENLTVEQQKEFEQRAALPSRPLARRRFSLKAWLFPYNASLTQRMTEAEAAYGLELNAVYQKALTTLTVLYHRSNSLDALKNAEEALQKKRFHLVNTLYQKIVRQYLRDATLEDKEPFAAKFQVCFSQQEHSLNMLLEDLAKEVLIEQVKASCALLNPTASNTVNIPILLNIQNQVCEYLRHRLQMGKDSLIEKNWKHSMAYPKEAEWMIRRKAIKDQTQTMRLQRDLIEKDIENLLRRIARHVHPDKCLKTFKPQVLQQIENNFQKFQEIKSQCETLDAYCIVLIPSEDEQQYQQELEAAVQEAIKLRVAAEQSAEAAKLRLQEAIKLRIAAEQKAQTSEQRAQTAEAEVARLKEALLQQQKPASPSQGGFFSPHSSPPVSNPVPPAPSSFTPAFTRTPEEH